VCYRQLLPEGLNALKHVARLTNVTIDGSYLNLDGGFDSRHNRKAIFNAGLIPNINENRRNRQTPKRGRKRLFNAAIHSLRLCVERTFAWEDKFKRLPLRFEFKQQRHYGMKLIAYTLINLTTRCGFPTRQARYSLRVFGRVGSTGKILESRNSGPNA
jgi:hypothetical protein